MKKALLLLIIPLLFVTSAIPLFAQGQRTDITRLPQDRTQQSDYFAANDRVELAGTVEGDAYIAGGVVRVSGNITNDLIAAGGDILVTGTIGQDVRIAGGNVIFSEATITGNVTVLGGQVTIDRATTVGGSVVSAGGNIQLLSPVERGITVAGGNVEVANTVGGDIWAATGELSLLNNANVAGNLNYISETEANIAEGATVSGQVSRDMPPRQVRDREAAKAFTAGIAGFVFFVKLADVLMLLLLGLLFIALMPNYMQRVALIVRNNFWITLLFGLIFVIITPIVAFLLMATVIGIPLGIFLLVLYAAMLWFAKIFGIFAFSEAFFRRNKSKRSAYGTYLVGVVIYFVLSFIPLVSFFADILLVLAGTGSFVTAKKEYYQDLRKKRII